jgi:hypothetical protein
MERTLRSLSLALLLALFVFSVVTPGGLLRAQGHSTNSGATSPEVAPPGAPSAVVAPDEVQAGTRLLLRLDDPISSKGSKRGEAFTAETLDRVYSADGTALTPGAKVRGHVDRVDGAGKTGKARLWLTFDDIQTPNGWLPLIAMVTAVPGVHSIRVNYNREGAIEANSVKRNEALEAAAAGALVGSAAGVASKDTKDAAMGAATAAAAAYMVSSGMGQEITLEGGTKVEVILERSLFFGRT